MKKINAFYLCCLFIVIPLTDILAQIPIGIYCGKSTTRDLSGTCYDVVDQTTGDSISLDEASKRLETRIKGLYVCSPDSCDFPNSSTCKLAVSLPKGELNSTGDKWCFKGEVEISCDECTEIMHVDPEIFEGSGVGGFGYHEHDHPDVELEQKNLFNSNAPAKIENIYPNPTTGMVHMDLNFKEKGQHDVEVMVTDLAGKQLLQKDYTQIPDRAFHSSIDLSRFSNGLYIISIRVNGQTVGSSKISVT